MDAPDRKSGISWTFELRQLVVRLAVVIVSLVLVSQGVFGQALAAVLIAAWLAFAEIRPVWKKDALSPLRRLSSYLRHGNGNPIQFQIKHVLYCVAVLGASLGLAGAPIGFFLAAIVFCVWFSVFSDLKNRQKQPETQPHDAGFTLIELLVVIAVIGVLISLLNPNVASIHPKRHAYRHLQQLVNAFAAYRADHGVFPPACIRDSDGTPLHSWRVLILPYLGQNALYASYNFDEPWDGPTNRKLMAQIPSEYQLRWNADPDGQTRFVAVVQENRQQEVMYLVDGVGRAVPWTQPVDLTMDQATELLTKPPSSDGFWNHGFLWSTTDGHLIGLLGGDLSWVAPRDRRDVDEVAALSQHGFANQNEILVLKSSRKWHDVHYGNMVRLLIFLVVVLWPIRWVRQAKNTKITVTTS